ncbi:hypothetical protein BN2476_560132 [Paraburkholderia piptadeniae]|uniref:Uncharacterized protein n=1 Tax=Paraburkholderia piptadeniae TaxID=1701573 RepID=A0A1N7SJ05_9BURK|nr:hypothetical protein BN2476_560132 [Paraburkholderia piptadeniae]
MINSQAARLESGGQPFHDPFDRGFVRLIHPAQRVIFSRAASRPELAGKKMATRCEPAATSTRTVLPIRWRDLILPFLRYPSPPTSLWGRRREFRIESHAYRIEHWLVLCVPRFQRFGFGPDARAHALVE